MNPNIWLFAGFLAMFGFLITGLLLLFLGARQLYSGELAQREPLWYQHPAMRTGMGMLYLAFFAGFLIASSFIENGAFKIIVILLAITFFFQAVQKLLTSAKTGQR